MEELRKRLDDLIEDARVHVDDALASQPTPPVGPNPGLREWLRDHEEFMRTTLRPALRAMGKLPAQ